MEPDGLNELKTYLYNKFQKYDDNDAKLTQAYLEAMIGVDMEAKNKSEFLSLYASSHYWEEQNEVKSYVLNVCTEEIEDKDLGLVRKINLN